MSYRPPRRLSVSEMSPNYNKEAIQKIDKVFVDGVHLPNCVAYDMGAGWAFGKKDGVWQPRVHGVVTVTLRQ